VAPRIRFLQQKEKQQKQQARSKNSSIGSSDEEESAKIFKKPTSKNSDTFDFNNISLNDDSLFTVKKNVNLKFEGESEAEELEEELAPKKIKIKTKASIVKQIRKKNIKVNEKVLFDDDDNVRRF
jgi:hypothetical protein